MSEGSGRRGLPSEPDPRVAELLPGLPRVAALDALLRDVDRLRLGLETDLTLAASAVDAGAPEVAHDLVEDDLREVRAFEARAVAHLERLARAERAAVAAAGPPAAVLQLHGRRRRLTRLLPAAPLAAAAAVAGFLLLSPQSTAPAPDATAVPAALATTAELERLSQQGAPPEALEQAAQELNAEISTLVARAEGDPAAARQALDLLRRSQAALQAAADPQALGEVLAQSQRLAARLLATLPPVAPNAVPPVSLPPLPVPTQPAQPAPAAPAPRAEVLPPDLPRATAAPARTPAARPAPPVQQPGPQREPAQQEPAQQGPAPRTAQQSARPSARPAPVPPTAGPLAPGADARTSTTLPLDPG